MDEDRVVATRRSLHAVAERVLAGPQYRAAGTIRLRVTPGGFGTPRFPATSLATARLDELRQVALDRGDMTVYLQETRALEATLLGLTGGGKLGEIFSRHTTNPMRRDRAVVFDVSSIDETETDLQAAVLLA